MNDYLVVPKVSVDFMQPENVMVSQAVQCVARWNKKFFPPVLYKLGLSGLNQFI